MSHFYIEAQGHKGEATRTGTKHSGARAEAKGWDLGGKVSMSYNSALDTDIVTLYTTRDNGRTTSKVASFAIVDGKLSVLETNYPELLL